MRTDWNWKVTTYPMGHTAHDLRINEWFRISVFDFSKLPKPTTNRMTATIYFSIGEANTVIADMKTWCSDVLEAKMWALARLREMMNRTLEDLKVPEGVASREFWEKQPPRPPDISQK